MDLVEYREFCLSLGDVIEKMPFGKFAKRYETMLVFYVCGHMFALCDIEDFSYVSVRMTEPEMSELFQTKSSVEMPVNKAMKYWATIKLGGDISDSDIYSLTRCAFKIIKEKYTKVPSHKK